MYKLTGNFVASFDILPRSRHNNIRSTSLFYHIIARLSMHMVQESTCFLTAPQWDRLYYDELQEFLVAYLTLMLDEMLSAMFFRLSRIRWSIVSQHQYTSKSQAVQNTHNQKYSSALLNLPYRPRHNESHSSKNPVSLHVIWPQKLAFTFDVLINEAAMLSMSWYYQNSKDKEKPTRFKWGKVHIVRIKCVWTS